MTTAFPLQLAIDSFLLSMPIKVSDMLERLRADGWVEVAQRVTVAGKPSSVFAIGTELSILKQAGLRRDDS